MSWFRWIASVAMLACSTGAAKAEERDTSIECWKGSYLTGFTGHAGHVIDTMSIICARWNPDRGRLDKPIVTTRGLIGRSDGGDPLDDVECPRGSAVAGGYSYVYARHDGVEALHHFDFNCRPVGGDGGLQPRRFGSNSNAEIVFKPASRRQCADGDLATGIKARHGEFILEWQLICTRGPGAIVLTKPAGTGVLRDRVVASRTGGSLEKGDSIIVGDSGTPSTPPPPSQPPPPPPQDKAEARNDTDVYRRVVTPDGKVIFERFDDDPGHFLPQGFVAPVLAKEGGWWKLDLKNVDFVKGDGWVAADQLKPSP